MKPRWRSKSSISASAAALFLLHATFVNAVALDGCSSQNTGGSETSNIYMTNGLCHDTCSSQGSSFAITQGQSCWCSNQNPASSTSTGSCNTNCPGFPSEKCGNPGQGLYGYIQVGSTQFQATGSGGGSGGGFGQSPPSNQPTSTVIQSVVNTVISTRVAPPSSSDLPTVQVTVTQSSTPTTDVVPIPVVPSSSDDDGYSSSWSATPVVSTQRVTVSGNLVTSVVTSTPTAPPSTPAPQQKEPKQTSSGLSNGAVAGITIGALAAAAILGVAIFFCWRQRRRENQDSEGGLNRNSSVLSRTGLLGRSASNRHEAVAGAYAAQHHHPVQGGTLPKIDTTGIIPGTIDPDSARTGSSGEPMTELQRRNSRPIFVDSRLNPNALMWQGNNSRTSIHTLQDNQDYSRPVLGVRNPDP